MAMLTKSSILAVVMALTSGSVAQAQNCPPSALTQSVAGEFTTVAGKTVMLPPVKSMKCSEIDSTLARIDSTRYRENAPQPHDKADCPLLNYELLLAEENYNRCVIARKKVTGGLLIMKRSKSK